ncbi:MAG: GAF domain-containing protein [Thermoanaerobaculia bacterium]|nr:MAG: GAF domain-containing protein [Thermoanaerobaculia bacterium]
MDAQEIGQRLAEQETLLELGRALAETLDLRRVLTLALEQVEQFCAAETSSIWELDEATGELFFRVVRGRAAPEIENLRIPLGEGIVGSVAASGRAEVIADVTSDPRWIGDAAREFDTRAILAVPLVSRGRVIGVLQLLNPLEREGFTADDLRRMQLFAGPVSHALENARLYSRLQRTFVETVTAFADAVERRDPYTGGHLHRVVSYSLLLGHQLGLPDHELERLRLGATLHDIGKIGVPDGVLLKPGSLDPAEAEIMRRHTVDGAAIVSCIESLRALVPIVRSHHERLDGSGYPDGLTGERIPLAARIVAVADTFDAMTTSRPYRRALVAEAAAAEIRRVAGGHLCPKVVGAFEVLYGEGRFTTEEGSKLGSSLSARLDREYNRW